MTSEIVSGTIIEAREIPWVQPGTREFVHTPEGYPRYLWMVVVERPDGTRFTVYQKYPHHEGCMN